MVTFLNEPHTQIIVDRLGDVDTSRRMMPSMTNHTTNHNGEGDEDLEQVSQSSLNIGSTMFRRENILCGKNIEEKGEKRLI